MKTTRYAIALGVIVVGLLLYALRALVHSVPSAMGLMTGPAVGLLAGLAGSITFMVADVKLRAWSYRLRERRERHRRGW